MADLFTEGIDLLIVIQKFNHIYVGIEADYLFAADVMDYSHRRGGMSALANATVRLFGKLYTFRRQRGLSAEAEIYLPEQGLPAIDVARQLDLPLGDIEGVFCNHKVYGLDHVLRPGDALAFIPVGVPGPHRFMLGIHAAGKGHLNRTS